MKKKTLKAVGALTGAAVLVSGFIPANEAVIVEENKTPAPEAIDGVKVEMGKEASYDEIANVKGEFAFCQDHVAPADEVFNLFGTVTTGICAKPGFAMDEVKKEDHYINVGGQIKKAASYSIEQLKTYLKNAGFTHIRVWADREFTAPRDGEQRVWFQARKGVVRKK